MSEAEAWIGLFEVAPDPGNNLLGDAMGAFVNVVGLGAREEDYRALVDDTLRKYGFRILAAKDVMPFKAWCREHEPDEQLVVLTKGLTAEFPIQFDELQSYLQSEDV